MQMDAEARAWLDDTVRRVLARYALGDAERAGITYELMSHLHAAGEARATAAGRTVVTRVDLDLALLEAGGEAQLAAAFVQPLARPMERVLLGRRAGAFAIDVLLLGLATTFLHGGIAFLLDPVFGPGSTAPGAPYLSWVMWLLPWGYHPMTSLAVQALIGVASAALVLGYFTWTEGQDGRSLGKRAVGLRVMRADGRPVTQRESFLRNVAKIAPLVLLADVLVMLLAFPNDKQRVSDKLADTIVVKV